MFKILKEVQLNIGVEKVDIHKEVMVKVLLDSGATEMFMNKEIAAKHGFRLQKLEKPLIVKNVNRMYNSRGAVTYQVEVNMYYKNHVKRMRIDVCDLEKTDIILGMLWLQAYNLGVTNFIRSYLHQFFDDSHGLKASLKPLRRPFDQCQSRLEAINNGRDIKQINW